MAGFLPNQSKRDAFLAYLAGRVIKLAANGLRPLFYIHYWLFPRQRFLLRSAPANPAPTQAATQSKQPRNIKIPKILWQTNYTNRVGLPVKITQIWNRLNAFDYSYCVHTDQDQLTFIEEHFPGKIHSLYKSLSIGAAKADLWRLLVLYKYGGVYIDMDAHLVWPLGRIIEPGVPEVFLRYKNKESTNYFIASSPGNPNIKAIIDEVLTRIEHSESNNVYDITGPGVFEDVLANRDHHWRLAQHTCLQGNFSNKFFQYLDKPDGIWTLEQKERRVVTR